MAASGAGRALALANNPANFLSTVQFGITVISILSGAIGEATLSEQVSENCPGSHGYRPYADRLAFWIPVTGIAVFSLILGELVPKRLALLNPEGIASAMARPMEAISAIAFPLVRLSEFPHRSGALDARSAGSRRTLPLLRKRSTCLWSKEQRLACSRSTSRRWCPAFSGWTIN